MNFFANSIRKEFMSLGHIMDKQYDIKNFIRIDDTDIEIFITGLSVCFTSLVRQNLLGNYKENPSDRARWISKEILSVLSRSELQDKQVTLDCRMENFFIHYVAKAVISNLSLLHAKILTSTDPKDVLENHEIILDRLAYVNYCFFLDKLHSEDNDWQNIDIDIPILSLAGRPTERRAMFAKNLLDICKDHCRVSLGNTSLYKLSPIELNNFKEILHPYSFPLNHNTDYKVLGDIKYQQDDPGKNLYRSLLAIVNETNDFTNDSIHLTEKSFKFFAWHQIPVFNASRNHVREIRKLGFDLFEDIIDHSYDDSKTEYVHDLKILNVVSKFLKNYSTNEDINNLRKQLYPRLAANYKLLCELKDKQTIAPWPEYG